MSQLTPWDHLFALVVFVAYPIYIWWDFPVSCRRIRNEGEPAKVRGYRGTIAHWIGFASVLTVLWIGQGRSWAELGFRWAAPGRLAAGLVLGFALLWLISVQLRQLRRADSESMLAEMGELATFMPRSVREERWFRGVAVNAGVTEELIYRGFLIWYLEPLVGIVAASVLAIVLFTLAHAYQGAAQLPGIAVASAAMVGLYLLSGTVFLPMIFHAAGDLLQGGVLARWLREQPEPARSPGVGSEWPA